MQHSIKMITQNDVIEAGCLDFKRGIEVCQKALNSYASGDVIYPDKVSVVFDQATQDRINTLPAGFKSLKYYGVKWVSVFPGNPHSYGLPNLSAVLLLSELHTGFPVAFIEGTLCSNMRTACMSALAARYLSVANPTTIGFIGAGEQAKSHLLAMKDAFPSLRCCKVSSRTRESEERFIEQMQHFVPDMEFVACLSSYEKAVTGADIIVTAISGQEKILQAEWIKPGAFYSHVGGLEDDFAVPLKASKIVCDAWGAVKHRTQTISRMYQQGLLSDDNIHADLHEIVSGRKCGREDDSEFIYYNGVGLSYVDVAFAIWVYESCKSKGLGADMPLSLKSVYDVSNDVVK